MGQPHSPAFGEADLSNCERELIHLAGSIQPHGLLLVLREPQMTVEQLSANCGRWLGAEAEALRGRPISALAPGIASMLDRLLASGVDLAEPAPIECRLRAGHAGPTFEGSVHRQAGAGLVVELQPAVTDTDGLVTDSAIVMRRLSEAVDRFAGAATLTQLGDCAVAAIRDLTGYDRVMVYRFDPDGHGQIIAEARDPRLESLLGHRYPATDIPQRARELYVRNRIRVLVDVHCEPVPIVPRRSPVTGEELDMSLCQLRSMSPLHLQYLKNMGVTATLVASLMQEGRLWGLIAAHHYRPRQLPFVCRAGCALLAEVASTRIAALENVAHAQIALLVRRLEQRLIEATSSEGDWRLAVFRNPRLLLEPLKATGAALCFEGEILTAGEVPSTPQLRALVDWVERRQPAVDDDPSAQPFHTSAVGRDNPDLSALVPVASGVLAVRLSSSRQDYLMWFRKEQLTSVTWAGNPAKPMVSDNPLELSPRRSFAAWSEIVRGTSVAWTGTELALARAVGGALVDLIVQVHAVRLMIAEQQLQRTRATVSNANQPLLVAAPDGRLLHANAALHALAGPAMAALTRLDDVPALFTEPAPIARSLEAMRHGQQWHAEATLRAVGQAPPVPVFLRAEAARSRSGEVLGFMLMVSDRRDSRRAAQARASLQDSLSITADGLDPMDAARQEAPDEALKRAILTHASIAALDFDDIAGSALTAPLLEQLEDSTRRAVDLYRQMRDLSGRG